MKKKLFWTFPLVSLPLLATPVIASACDNKEVITKRAEQERIINEKLTFNHVLVTLTNTYLQTFYANDLTANLSTNNEGEKQDKIASLYSNKNSQLYKDLYEIFKIYADRQIENNPQFFSNLRNTFIEAKIDVENYNPAPFVAPNEDEFLFIMNNSNVLMDNLRYEIQKLLLVRNYLLKDREELRALANNENGLDKQQAKIVIDEDKTPEREKILFKHLNAKENTLHLIKYLLDNPLIQTWEFNDSRDMNLRWKQGEIRTADDYNRLAEYNPANKPLYKVNEVAKHPELLVATGANENIDLTTLRSYKGISKATGSVAELATDIYSLKSQESPIYGFVDANSKKVYSQDSFTFAKLLKQELRAPLAKISDLKKAEINENKAKTLSPADIELTGLTKVEDPKKTIYQKEVTLDQKTYHMLFEITSVLSNLDKTRDIEITVHVSVKELEKRQHLVYKSTLNNLENEITAKEYNLNLYRDYVNALDNTSKMFNPKYVVKIVPLLNEDPTLEFSDNKANSTDETKKAFNFKNTPWDNETQQKIIANHIIFLDTNDLFKKANAYFKELGFKMDESKMNTSIAKKLKLEGLL
ncbi:Uncharacterised protein [Metamycoplasma cloacale]|uniref:Uncharacterized protein n=1 Tax=Metamycoplasma cloacale TaxID=92401 RepID=A0A2Z4LMU7_9BACT|nr:hypothetical protein [Metamycoplasma cloacale]AWX42974.1 hypothetical protein DK849_02795 [Metamycoplasma cloacale]VEU79202.1 Uncharacterised protein [Metamycoplasma cloacale]